MNPKIILTGVLLVNLACQAQTKKEMVENKNNPLLCDPETGICEMPMVASTDNNTYIVAQKKPIKIIYFTDPICSSCWGIEPQLRKLKLEYGNDLEIDYRMGGLLPDWSYNNGGISKPSDVAHHWDEVSQYYEMPIDGDVWLEKPLHSSYPPSIAFKAAQLQDITKAIKFLRRIREMVFLEKKNITYWEHLSDAASQVGLDTIQLKKDYETRAKELFLQDLALAKKLGVRGFPTLYFADSLNNQQVIFGFKPYRLFENAVISTYAGATKASYDTSWEGLFGVYPTLTSKEFAELSGLSKNESEVVLNKLVSEKKLTKYVTKNGAIWSIR